jgi:hypothetical protein
VNRVLKRIILGPSRSTSRESAGSYTMMVFITCKPNIHLISSRLSHRRARGERDVQDCLTEIRNTQRFSFRNLKERAHAEDLDVNRRTPLKYICM